MGNWELVKSIVGTKLKISHVCLHSQVGINGFALFHYAMIVSVQKLIQVVNSNTAGSLIIQRQSSKMLKRMLKSQLKQTGIDQKRFSNQ